MTAKKPQIHVALNRRIRSAVEEVVRRQSAAGVDIVNDGSDCGYGTWVGQAAVDPDVVWAKMAAMAEGARIASKQFWKTN